MFVYYGSVVQLIFLFYSFQKYIAHVNVCLFYIISFRQFASYSCTERYVIAFTAVFMLDSIRSTLSIVNGLLEQCFADLIKHQNKHFQLTGKVKQKYVSS